MILLVQGLTIYLSMNNLSVDNVFVSMLSDMMTRLFGLPTLVQSTYRWPC